VASGVDARHHPFDAAFACQLLAGVQQSIEAIAGVRSRAHRAELDKGAARVEGCWAPVCVEDSRLELAVSAGFLRVWPRAGL
jgi:hypothetical protein